MQVIGQTLAQMLANEWLDIYTYTNGSNYFKLWGNPTNIWDIRMLSGAYVVYPNAGQETTLTLTHDQTRQLGVALGLHISTGQVNVNIGGILTVVTNAPGVDITVVSASYLTHLSDIEVAKLAQAAMFYTVTRSRPPENFYTVQPKGF